MVLVSARFELAWVRLIGSRLKRAKKSSPSFRRYNHDYDFDLFRDYELPMHNTEECCKTYTKNAVLTFFVLVESTQVKCYKCLRLYTV